jgi:hypothetical protein
MFESTVSVDLGASYTKVAYRKSCSPTAGESAKEPAQVFALERTPLIPSIAVHTKRPAQPWVFGVDAAKITPSKEMEVFQNWKASLFRPQNDKDSAAAVIVATQFFGWLKGRIEASGVPLDKVETRVAMPAFKTFDEKALIIARCMELGGWNSPLILKATEPHANTVGLFSSGRNVVTRPGNGEGTLNFGQMFGERNAWVQRARNFTLYGTQNNLLVAMVIDIGAFTTDIAAIIFDVAAADDNLGDGLKYIQQESYPLGILNELDRPLFSELGVRHNFDWSALSFEEREIAKRALYQGRAYALQPQGKPQIVLGEAEDQKVVSAHCGTFAQALWDKVLGFVQSQKPSVVYLTGGGALIPPIVDALQKHFRQHNISLGNVDQDSVASGQQEWRIWNETGEGMQRLATAVGGASVILQASSAVFAGEGQPPQARAPIMTGPIDSFFPCSCNGGNKDCCRCGGRGFYSKP